MTDRVPGYAYLSETNGFGAGTKDFPAGPEFAEWLNGVLGKGAASHPTTLADDDAATVDDHGRWFLLDGNTLTLGAAADLTVGWRATVSGPGTIEPADGEGDPVVLEAESWALVHCTGTAVAILKSGAGGSGGAVNLVPTGEWEIGDTYAALEAVSFEGSSYVSLVEGNLGNQPDESPTEWMLLAEKGEIGNAGTITIGTVTGVPYGDPPTVTNVGTSTAAELDFEIPAGAPGATGPAWDQWEGAWQTATAYVANDAVESGGSSYICTSPHTSGPTTEPGVGVSWATKWDLVAAKGTDGAGAVHSVNGLTGNVVIPVREVLTANRTYYVNGATGNDSNNGLSAPAAFATIAKALAVVATIDAAGKTVTIQLADGTYSVGVVLPNVVGIAKPGDLILQGNTGDASAVTITSSSARTIDANGISTPWRVQYLTVTCTNTAYEAIIARGPGTVLEVGNVIAKYDGVNCVAHFAAQAGGLLRLTANCSVDGGAYRLFQGAEGAMLDSAFRTITFLNNATFTTVAEAHSAGNLKARGMTFTLGGYTVTGKRYDALLNGIVNTVGGGASYFPGNASGTTATGGQYV